MKLIFSCTSDSLSLIATPSSYPAEVINRERMSAHMFEVTVQSGEVTQSAMLHIVVLDENDNTPTFLNGSYFSLTVAEDQEVRGGCG